MRSKPPRWAIRNCSEPEDDTDTIAASALRDKLAGCVARFADRRDDWSVFGFETALDPKFARAQRRYLGASGSVDHNDLRGWIPATAFTMSIQSMPPGNRIPMHCHETKEISFILERQDAGAVLGERREIRHHARKRGSCRAAALPAGRGVQRRRQHLPSADLARQAAAATSAVQRPGAFEAAGGYSMSTTRITVADRTPEGFPHSGQSVGRKATAYSLPCPVHTGERRLTSDSGRSGLMA
jgi:hypothetical protein